MIKNESPPPQNSTSSTRADDSERSDAILVLERKLVDELGLEPSVDTLGRWMAHYVSELIARGEKEDGEDKEAAKKECFDAILTLWKHRSELPNGKRPFEGLEPIVRAIASLDPEDETPRYFRQARPPKGEDEEEPEVESWLKLADGLDYSAKLPIGYCLTQAANSAVNESWEWVKLAKATDANSDPFEIVIRFISDKPSDQKRAGANLEVRRQMEDRAKRLQSFVKLAENLAQEFENQLAALPPAAEPEDEFEVLSVAPHIDD